MLICRIILVPKVSHVPAVVCRKSTKGIEVQVEIQNSQDSWKAVVRVAICVKLVWKCREASPQFRVPSHLPGLDRRSINFNAWKPSWLRRRGRDQHSKESNTILIKAPLPLSDLERAVHNSDNKLLYYYIM